MPNRPPADKLTPELQAQELRTKPAGKAGSGPGSHILGPQDVRGSLPFFLSQQQIFF